MIRGPIRMLIVGVVMLFVTALVTFGPRGLEGVLPTAVVTALDGGTMGTAEVGDTYGKRVGAVSAGDRPDDFVIDAPDGLKVTGPVAARAGNAPVFIDDIITGYDTRVAEDIPAEVTTIRPITGCRLTPPQEGTRVGLVVAGSTGLTLPMSTYTDVHLASAVQVFVNVYRDGATGPVVDLSGPPYEAYDVAVTETRVPVYLVLETGSGNRIWNIHLAKGARIERVVLLGGDQAGVANLDPVVPVEVILGQGLADCGILPARPLNPGHRFFEVLNEGPESNRAEAEADLARMQERIAAYDTWLRDSFGIAGGEVRAGFDDGTISLVGPVPGQTDPMAVYAPIAGAKIRATRDQYFEIRGQVPKGEDFAARVKAIATTFAFGDLEYLRQGAEF